ncbi:hypothetical protein [Variovorax sp. dw_954]|uniref:hypothetical protein n=1 Tax=Variovorax sp. dw_954 TaxID=2720078 RepID=UPI001BD64BD3|nr:hypothetical protein [Variovorax sp. dw_954]
MGKYVPIRFNDEEAGFLERSFAASDDVALSTHIKRVYFDALRPNTDALAGVRSELEKMGSLIGRLEQPGDGAGDQRLMLSILCGLYVMVRKSVGDSIRAQADQVLDVSAIETYLRGR